MRSLKVPYLIKRKIRKSISDFKRSLSRAIRKIFCNEKILVTNQEIFFQNKLPDFTKKGEFFFRRAS